MKSLILVASLIAIGSLAQANNSQRFNQIKARTLIDSERIKINQQLNVLLSTHGDPSSFHVTKDYETVCVLGRISGDKEVCDAKETFAVYFAENREKFCRIDSSITTIECLKK